MDGLPSGRPDCQRPHFSRTMKLNLLELPAARTLGLALLMLAASSRADIEDTITKSFNAPPGGQLVVQVDRGSIELKTSDRESVDIELARRVTTSPAKAQEIFKDHVVTMTQDGNKVEVRAEYKGEKRFGWFGSGPNLNVACVITVPRKFDADIKTAGGHISVVALTGKLKAHTSGGGMTFEKIEGPLTAHTSGGHVTVTGCKGNVVVNTSGGGLSLSEIEGDVTARTSGGSIHARKLTGKSVVRTSGGSIEATAIKGQIEARTSGGSVSAELLGQPAGDCTFTTSGGSVTITLDAKAAVDVDARTSAGRVSTEFPVTATIQGEQKKNELHGKVNGGGSLITAHTSAGSVRLKRR